MLDNSMEENRTRESYKTMKQLNREWAPTQSMRKDKNGNIKQGREETKRR